MTRFAIVLAFILVSLGYLTGCTPTTIVKYEVIEKKQVIVADLDDSLIEPCVESKPPARDNYLQSNRDRKEALLTGYVADLILNNKRCSLDKLTLKNMLEAQRATVKKFNEDEELRVKVLTNSKKQPDKVTP